MIALIALLQTAAPTVGDTIWLERTITAPVGAEVRPGIWPASSEVELLGRPLMIRDGNRVTVRYPAVAWSAGSHTVELPGPIVVQQDGRTDSLPPEPRSVTVASVLPPAPVDSVLALQPQAGLIVRPVTSPWPVVAFFFSALLIVYGMSRWWFKRGPAMPKALRPARHALPPVEQWLASGEARAVAATAFRALRGSLAAALPEATPALDVESCLAVVGAKQPEWPVAELGDLLHRLDRARFADRTDEDVAELCHLAESLSDRLAGAAP